jgi:hypothetical protein
LIDKEKEYRNAFYFLKRWSKSPLTPSSTIGYGRGNADKEPAQKCYDYFISLSNDTSLSFQEKLDLIYKFLEKVNEEDKKKHMMGTHFYNNFQSYIRISFSNIEKGLPVQTRRR